MTTCYVNCSEDNEYFYSKDGKLYDKKTDIYGSGGCVRHCRCIRLDSEI